MKNTVYTSYEELPLLLNMKKLADLLGVSHSNVYELIQEDFPSLRIGKRIVIPKDELRKWISAHRKGVYAVRTRRGKALASPLSARLILRQQLEQHPENLPPMPSRPTRASGAKLAQAASPRSTKSSGKDDTLLSGQTAKNTPATSMPTARQSVKNFSLQ